MAKQDTMATGRQSTGPFRVQPGHEATNQARSYRAKVRPSGHVITTKFQRDHGGSISSNLLARGNNESNSAYIKACAAAGRKPHPARFPAALPEFFVKFLN